MYIYTDCIIYDICKFNNAIQRIKQSKCIIHVCKICKKYSGDKEDDENCKLNKSISNKISYELSSSISQSINTHTEDSLHTHRYSQVQDIPASVNYESVNSNLTNSHLYLRQPLYQSYDLNRNIKQKLNTNSSDNDCDCDCRSCCDKDSDTAAVLVLLLTILFIHR